MSAYDLIGDGYNQTRKADPYLVSRLLYLLSSVIGQSCLDIGCGTGNYTQALSSAGIQMIGVDPAKKMLRQAEKSHPDIDWRIGQAESIPVRDEAVMGAVATLTTHHWKNLGDGFAEVRRVLRPGGRFVLFTSTPHLMRRYWLIHYFPEMMAHSMAVMPSLEQTVSALTQVGIKIVCMEPYDIQPSLTDQFLYSGKYHPERYLDPRFRSGISSFRLFADSEELNVGLKRLSADIESGEWRVIREKFEHSDGDYVFLVGEK